MRTLVVGNEDYSSWSLRPWIFMKHHGLAFEEIRIPLYGPDSRAAILKHSPSGKVPMLIDGDLRIWDSLAILEYLAEKNPETKAWPSDAAERAFARSICAEMHSGFGAMREELSMNVRRVFPPKARSPEVQRDVERVDSIWRECFARPARQGPYLFGRFSAADAMYAPVVWRFTGYSVDMSDAARAYCDTMLDLPAMRAWRADALLENETLPQFERTG